MGLQPYASRLALEWLRDSPDVRYRTVTGTLVFADISGFTRLTERLAAKGRFGAEEMSDHLDHVLSALLGAAAEYGGWLVKWGGDALLLMFDDSDESGDDAARACAAAASMLDRMTELGRLDTSVGRVRLRMSVGIHSGTFEFVFVGRQHRELLITGAAATTTADLEATAEAGEIAISPDTAARLPASCRGPAKGDGILLAATPPSRTAPLGDPPALDDEEVRRVLPELVAAHLLAGGGAGEHRQVAVAFVEFRGIVALRESRGPAGVVEALEHLVDVAEDACHRFSVSLHETDISADGGKLMLVAGAPAALADPCEAMLCVAREIVDNPGELAIRVGVTTGRVFTGAVGPAYRRSYSAKGDIVNLAARVMGKTQAGQVWAIPAVITSSRTRFDTEPVAPFMVKGKKAAVEALSVGPPVARSSAGDEIAFVGRIAELASLWAAARHAERGAGAAVDIVGPAGAGKTRLLAEASRLTTGFAHLGVGAEPHRTATAYGVIRPLLQQALGLGTAEGSTLRTRLLAWAEARAPDLQPWLPLLGVALDVDLPDTTETAEIDERFRRARIEETVVAALTRVLTGATFITVDDAQFADDASLGVLRHLADTIGERPWLLVTARRGDPDGQAMELGPLPEDEARALVTTDTEETPLAAHVVSAIVERADGNPMFLRELARAAAESPDTDVLPDSVENIVAAQLGALPPADRDLLRAASVIGMSVDPVQLAALLDTDEVSVATRLHELRNYLGPDGRLLRFRQALVHDAAYEGLPFRRRAALHGRLADLVASPDDGSGAAALSFHLFHAGRFADAAIAATVAAERAASAYANTEAETLFGRAVAATRRTPSPADHDIAHLLEGLADVRVRLGAFDRADSTYASARRLYRDDAVAVGRVGMKTARSASQQGNYALTLGRLRRAQRHVADAAGPDAERLRLDLEMRSAYTQFRQGKLEAARTTCIDLLAHTDELRAPDVVAEALGVLDLAELGLGRAVEHGRAEHALELYEQLGDLSDQARLLNQIGYRAYFDGNWTEAVGLYEQSRDLFSRSGDSPNAAVADANIAEILVDQGRATEAEERLRAALHVWRASGARNDAAFACSLLGRVLAREGDYEEARSMLAAARAQFAAQGARTEVIDADTYLAECLLLEGRTAEALDLARSTLAAARSLSELPAQAPLLHRIVAACLDEAGDHDGAGSAYAAALAIARSREAAHEVAFTLTAMSARSRYTDTPPDPAWLTEVATLRSRLGLVIDLTDHTKVGSRL